MERATTVHVYVHIRTYWAGSRVRLRVHENAMIRSGARKVELCARATLIAGCDAFGGGQQFHRYPFRCDKTTKLCGLCGAESHLWPETRWPLAKMVMCVAADRNASPIHDI